MKENKILRDQRKVIHEAIASYVPPTDQSLHFSVSLYYCLFLLFFESKLF